MSERKSSAPLDHWVIAELKPLSGRRSHLTLAMERDK